MNCTAKIEQTYEYKKRMRYIPATDSFVEKDSGSLAAEKGFVYPYGWIKESGTPPCEHLDVIVMTEQRCALGDELEIRVVGVFCRRDGDFKLVSVPVSRPEQDIGELPKQENEALERLYPAVFTGEGWFGREKAEKVISDFFSRRKRKFIFTVQHTESEHHTNGCIGAGYDWKLTKRGREQAYEVGKWLRWEDCDRAYHMYVSTMARARQTAEEIDRALNLPQTFDERLREVDAGEGNGKPRKWYIEHEVPHPGHFDIDYKPFPDAESDRELWERVHSFYREIIDSDEERILIVAHGTSLSFLHSMLLGYSVTDREHFRFNGKGGSISKFVIEPEGRVVCEYINHRIF